MGITTDHKEITNGIKTALRSHLNSALSLAAIDIRSSLYDMIDSLLIGSNTYQSLLTGTLRGDFGLADPEVRLKEILETLKKSLEVSFIPVQFRGDNLRGGLVIKLIRADFEDILNLSAASYKSHNFQVEWLRWLLTAGDSVIIATYHVKSTNLTPGQARASRSGIAIMENGGGWRVPAEYSGTLSDNWLTRIFDPSKVEKVITDIVEKALSRRL
jgi:hypothetical protein